MNARNRQCLKLSAIAAALSAVYGMALAQDAAVAEHAKPQSSVSGGVGAWSSDRPQQGIYDGQRKDGGYGLLDLDINTRNDATGTWLNFWGRNLGLETREFRGEWNKQGDMGVFLEYGRTPRYNPLIIDSTLRGAGTTTPITSGTGANALPSGRIELGTKRDLTTFGFYKNLAPGLDFKVNFKNEEKNGTRMWSRGGAAEFLVEPIDSNTRQLEATLEYVTKAFQLNGGYYGSWYRNANSMVTSLQQGAAATTYYLSLPLDNQAHQFFANGGYNFTKDTRGTFKVAYTKATQNEILPTSLVPGLALATAPNSLNGRLDLSNVQLGVTSRVTSAFSLAGSLRYYSNVEKTPQARYVQTGAGTCATTATCVDNTPLSFKTLTGKLEGTYRLPQGYSVIGAVERSDQDRAVPVGTSSTGAAGFDRQRYVPFRTNVDETTARLQVRRSMTETINGSLAYLYSDRKGSSYSLTNEVQSDGINPIHISDRKRDKWRLTLDWTPVDRLAFTFNAEDARDKYGNNGARPYGLRNGNADLYSLDASYSVSEDWKLTAWYAYDKTKANQYNQRSPNGGAVDTFFESKLSDTGNSFGVGVRGQPHVKFKLGGDLQYTKNTSSYVQNINAFGASTAIAAGSVGPLSDIHNSISRVKLFGTWLIDKQSELRFDLIHERWKTDDWSWMFANGTPFTFGSTGAADGTTVTQNPRQTSTYLGGRYTYKF